MRLRSSQFVFLLLLLGSVQLREVYTLRLVAGVSGRTGLASQRHESPATSALQSIDRGAPPRRVRVAMELDTASLTAHQAPRSMPAAARDAASISHHTSLLRG